MVGSGGAIRTLRGANGAVRRHDCHGTPAPSKSVTPAETLSLAGRKSPISIMIRDDFYWDELPLDVLIRFDALPRQVQKLLAIHLRPNEDHQAYCKDGSSA
jgi:hypothetical protein